MEPPRQAGVGPRIQYAQMEDGVSSAYSLRSKEAVNASS